MTLAPDAPRIVCTCLAIGRGRERVVAVYPEAVHGAGPSGAWSVALREAKRWGTADKVTVDFWPPTSPGLTFEVSSVVMRQVEEVTPRPFAEARRYSLGDLGRDYRREYAAWCSACEEWEELEPSVPVPDACPRCGERAIQVVRPEELDE